MGFEQRKNQTYYYRKRRSGDRVLSVYEGRGEGAALIAQLEAREREQRTAKRVRERAERQRFVALDEEMREVTGLIHTLMEAVLLTNGYHQLKRQWRRHRG